jgi:hypothetical protein
VVFLNNNEEVADALHSKTRDFNRTEQYALRLMIVFTAMPTNLSKKLKKGRMNGFAMVWRTAMMGRLIAMKHKFREYA